MYEQEVVEPQRTDMVDEGSPAVYANARTIGVTDAVIGATVYDNALLPNGQEHISWTAYMYATPLSKLSSTHLVVDLLEDEHANTV
jgi:hypothetical protein